MAESQLNKIKDHLKWEDSITSWDAIQKFGITRLASIIHILRTKHQMNIQSKNIVSDGQNWVEYRLITEEEGQYTLLGRKDTYDS